MGDNSLAFLYIVFGIAIVAHFIAGIVTLAFVIPLQLREAKVKNGLATLRKQMLLKGVIHLIVIVVSILALTLRFIIPNNLELLRYIISFMILLHGVGIFSKSVIDLKIYRQQYTPSQKRLHARMDRMEKKRLKSLK